MDKPYNDLVECLDDKDQSILQEMTKAEIWKRAYAVTKKIALKEIDKLEKEQAAEKLKKERKAAEVKRKKEKEKKKKAERKAKREANRKKRAAKLSKQTR